MTAKWTRPADIRDQLQRFWDEGISVPTEADGLALIGERRRLLGELLDAVLPPAAIDASATGANGFAQRYGLRQRPTLIRFRVLDPSIAIAGLTDLSVPVDDFAALSIPPGPVFITENKINGLAFPACRGGLVIFGLGYGVEALSAVPWLQRRRID
ncbi:hypothetical protein A6K26_009090 [Gammaproteobacteria bacterium 2W06]|nr:hypothetical protein A6K26_009090 [Gammaproteobacteria bacterium 2W06]